MTKIKSIVAAAIIAAIFPLTGFAQDCISSSGAVLTVNEAGRSYRASAITDYIANIGPRDMQNSNGVMLGNFAAVIQQDRANLYKMGWADGDGPFTDSVDGYFTTPARRAALSTAKYFTNCGMSARETQALKDDILNARINGVIWVVPFNRANGGLGVYISNVN